MNKVKIEEINKISEKQNQQKIQEAKRLFVQGQKLINEAKYKEALIKFDESIKQFNKEQNIYVWKGIALDSLNNFEEAIQCYNKAIEINPNHEYAWNNKGLALNNLNRFQEAIECLDKAILIDSQDDYAFRFCIIYSLKQ